MSVLRPGVVNINKPIKWTSRDVLNYLQHKYHYKKFGHAGTLDPLATGVLLVLIGDYTKNQTYFMGLKKVYQTTFFIGINSKTDDLEGPFDEFIINSVSQQDIVSFLDSKIGVHLQKVPLYSAVKVEGLALYKKARAGHKNMKIPTKKVELLSYKILEYKNSVNIVDIKYLNSLNEYEEKLQYLENNCSYITVELNTGSGFYVRSLARELGEHFKCGCLVGTLLRKQIGDYKIKDSLNINHFDTAPNIL